MDSYNGSINDPVSLHKYLYANANPVMYSDPSGYMSLGEVATVGAVIGALSSGLITVGMNILKNYDETGELKCDVTFGEVAVSMIIGGAFGALGAVALYCKIVWLTYLLASIAFSNGVGTAVIGYFEYENGNYGSAMGYSILSILSFIGAGKLFSKANTFSNTNNKSTFRIQLEEALKNLDKSGLRPGQTQISESRVQQIVENYNSFKANSSIYSDGKTRYVVDGHHTTIASEINGTGTGFNMGTPTEQQPSATNVYWWREWYEIWKTVIEIIE
jgi:hypothetical protein